MGNNGYLVVHPTNRVGGLVHPSYVCGRLAPHKNPIEITRVVTHPPERFVGSSPPSGYPLVPGKHTIETSKDRKIARHVAAGSTVSMANSKQL